jgi:hypothetical protein
MAKSRKVNTRKNTTLFQKKTYRIDGYGTQHFIKLLGYPILLGSNDSSFYIKLGDNEKGFIVTEKPLFSVRYKYKKSLKLGKYYFIKL